MPAQLAVQPRNTPSHQPAAAVPDTMTPTQYTAAELADRSTRQLVDVLAGRRQLDQVRSWVSRPVAGLLSAMISSPDGAGRGYRLLSVHPCLTSPSTIEASAIITDTRAARALSLRFQRRRAEWSCTLLALV